MSLTPQELRHLETWIDQTETQRDQITAVPVRALAATLDRDDPPPQLGDALPPLWHWLYFLPTHQQADLGSDGHPKRGGFLPPVPLPRRMWAGGRLEFVRPICVGETVSRTSRIANVRYKKGRTGELVFVLVRHEISGANGLALTEEHDIVYRDVASAPAPEPPAAAADAAFARTIQPDDVLLFRYSALTFNGHRIHYDRRYVTEVEIYPGLVVHGPLIATYLVDLLRRSVTGVALKKFAFRAVSPLYDNGPFTVCGKPDGAGTFKLWAQNAHGGLAMEATASVEIKSTAS